MRYFLLVLVVIVAAVALFGMPKAPNLPRVTVGAHAFEVEVANTEAARELGLGQRDTLPTGHGMLFVFEYPGNWGFWMKDTRFALDIIWARQDGTVITVEHNVATSTYPTVFYPAAPEAAYVLEVAAGAANDVAPGQVMTIKI